jgi:hypothetical protein
LPQFGLRRSLFNKKNVIRQFFAVNLKCFFNYISLFHSLTGARFLAILAPYVPSAHFLLTRVGSQLSGQLWLVERKLTEVQSCPEPLPASRFSRNLISSSSKIATEFPANAYENPLKFSPEPRGTTNVHHKSLDLTENPVICAGTLFMLLRKTVSRLPNLFLMMGYCCPCVSDGPQR